MGSYEGKFAVPPDHTVEVLFHRSGLEEYRVDGKLAFSSRAWEYSGFRDFEAGDHSVRIRFSLTRMYCKAYVDGKLAVRDVFPRMKELRGKLKKNGYGYNPFWFGVVRLILLTYLFVNVLRWIFS